MYQITKITSNIKNKIRIKKKNPLNHIPKKNLIKFIKGMDIRIRCIYVRYKSVMFWGSSLG